MIYKFEAKSKGDYRTVIEVDSDDGMIRVHSHLIDCETINHDKVDKSYHNEELDILDAKELVRALNLAIEDYEIKHK